MHSYNILIQGDRNAGKTYLIHRIIKRFGNSKRLAGFYTWKIADGTVRFRTWDNFEHMETGPAEIIYSEDDRTVRQQVFEELGVRSIEHAIERSELMVFDELGRFEASCERFKEAIRKALAHETPLLAALKSETNPFLDSLRGREDISLFSITLSTREEVFGKVADRLDEILQIR
jgi:nucleoside-triphosphatase THEP1